MVIGTARLFDQGDLESLATRYHPDAVVHHPEGWPEPGPSVGREAVVDQYRRLRDTWGDLEVVMDEVEAAEDWVAVRFRLTGEGSGSGIPTDQSLSAAYRIAAERLIAEAHFSFSYAEARKIAGLA